MTKKASAHPLAPRLGEQLHPNRAEDLLGDAGDDEQWTRLEISGDLSGAQLRRIDVAECRFAAARLSGADLQGARIVDAAFFDCDLSGASLADVVLTRVTFHNCRLSGLVLTSAKLRDVRITECKADHLSARMVTAERLTCERTVLRDADFYGARLDLTRLFDCDLTSAEFSKTSFRDVRLHGSDLAGLRGIEHVRGVAIDHDQMHDFAASLLAAHDVTVDDDRDPTATS